MKKKVLFMVLMMVGVNLFAQRNMDLSMTERQAARMKSELSLSDEQVMKLTEINKKFQEDQARMRSDTTLTREGLMTERKQLIEAREKQIKTLLTKEQYDRFMAMKPAHGREADRSKKRVNPMEELKKEVGLNDEQVKKIMAINKTTGSQFREVRSDSTIARDARGEAFKKVSEERRSEIKKILTEEQYAKFVAYETAKIKERRGARPLRH